ncbi:MAG: glycine cleavage system protein GcvH [Thermoplasmata archaeon]
MTETKVPGDRYYTTSHEWVKSEDGVVLVGITDHAQSELTDIVFVDLPPVGKSVASGATVLVLESVKTVADVYAPRDGTVSAVNAELKLHPEWINQDPYGKGWLFKLTLGSALDPSALLDAGKYRAFLVSDHASA